jgi:tetratricopeptide (TPR) repeat protein
LLFNEGHDDEALKEFTTATQLDGKNYIAWFARTMISPASRSASAQDQQETYEALNHVLSLKLDFAPAYVELAKLAIRRGQSDTALALSKRAEQLEPYRSGYRVLSARILLLLNRPSEAAAEAAYVAQRWFGSDRDEAMEVWNQVRAADRHVEAPTTVEPSDKPETTEGKVQSVSCDGLAFGITLDVNGRAETFRSTGFPVGFSDIFWVGRDHFTPCFHVQGLRVKVRYKPSKDSSYAGDLIYAGFRDDPAEPASAAPSDGGMKRTQ